MPSLMSMQEIAQLALRELAATGYRAWPAMQRMVSQVPPEQLPIVTRTVPQLAIKALQRTQGLDKGAAELTASTHMLDDIKRLMPAEPAAAGSFTAFPRPMLPANLVAPEKTSRFTGLLRSKTLRRLASHSNVNEHIFGTEGNISYDFLDSILTSFGAKARHLMEWHNVSKGIGGVRYNKAFLADMQQAIEPVIKDGSLGRLYELEGQAHALRMRIQRAGGPQAEKGQPLVAQLQRLQARILPLFQHVEQHRIPFLHKWAQQEPAVRMSLALEPRAHPWAVGMLQGDEQRIVDAARRFIDMTKGEATRMRIPWLDVPDYAPLLNRAVSESLGGRLGEEAALVLQKIPRAIKWQHRGPGYLNWLPDLPLQMHMYINQANDKFAKTAFFNKWRPYLYGTKGTRWSGKGLLQKNPDAFRYVTEDFIQEYMKQAEAMPSRLGRLTDWVTWAEYVTKIGGSTTTATKHGFKQLFLLAQNPERTVRGVSEAMKSAVRMGLKGAGMHPMFHDRMMQQLLSAKYLYRAMTGLQESMGGKSPWLRFAEVAASMPTSAVEYLERGAAIYASMMKGLDKGQNFHEVMRGVYQTMLDINFMGVVDRPSWLASPLKRLTFLFFFTPFKIMERSLGKYPAYALQNAAQLVRNRGKLIEGLRDTLSSGDIQKFKEGLVQASLGMRRDAFGTPYGNLFVKALVTVGGLDIASRQLTDTSILGHAVHIPGTRSGAQGMQITMPPYIQLYNDWKKYGGDALAIRTILVEHFWPTQVSRLYRISKGDIPKRYAGSKARYLMGLASEEAVRREAEGIRKRLEPFEGKQRKRAIRRMTPSMPEAVRKYLTGE